MGKIREKGLVKIVLLLRCFIYLIIEIYCWSNIRHGHFLKRIEVSFKALAGLILSYLYGRFCHGLRNISDELLFCGIRRCTLRGQEVFGQPVRFRFTGSFEGEGIAGHSFGDVGHELILCCSCGLRHGNCYRRGFLFRVGFRLRR